MARTEVPPRKNKPPKPGTPRALKPPKPTTGNPIKRAADEYEITGGDANCSHDWWHWSGEDRCRKCGAVRKKK